MPAFYADVNRYVTPGRPVTPATREADSPPKGNGYLAGESPSGTATIDGVPGVVSIRVLYRPQPGGISDGVLVATTTSAADGTWRVDGLDASLKYDVIGRKSGFKDVIVSDVSPAVD